ncbi:MAG TPA: DUF5686 family protein [Bacteroidia bacterium]|nr:DUF5686 family protein [Bacteroidia bacterium]
MSLLQPDFQFFRSRIMLPVMLLCLMQSPGFSQTKVKGKIIDAETNEGLPFVNVMFPGTSQGTTSDIDGNFLISTDQPVDSVSAFFLGYTKNTKHIRSNTSQEVNFVLRRKTNLIQEVVIHPGENPALRIIRNVIARKDSNNREKLKAYEYQAYNKVEFDLKDIPRRLQKRKVLRPMKFAFDHIDSSNAIEKPQLPILISETVSRYYYRTSPTIKKEIIQANKLAGVDQKSIAQFMGDMYLDVNLYLNNILVFGKDFISPVADNALLYYRYYLTDSVYLNGHRCYELQFSPRRKQELLFSGTLWIADTAWAVKRIQMKVQDDANINFINQLQVNQEYEVMDGHWMLVRDHLFADLYIPGQKTGLYGRKTAVYSDIKVNRLKEDGFYDRTHNLVVDADPEKPDAFWVKARPDSLSKNEQGIYQLMDTIQKLPFYKTWYDIVLTLAKGYKPVGNFEIGPYYSIFSTNRIEGGRIRLGGRTSDKFSKWYELNGYCAYGLKDEQFKYKLGFRTFITKSPRQLVGMSYKSDYELLGQSQNAFTQDNFFVSLLRRSPIRNMTNVQQFEAYYEREWFTGFSTKLFFTNRTMTPISDFQYQYYDRDGALKTLDNIKTTEITIITRLAWNEKYIDGTFSHIPTGTKYPIPQLIYTKGIRNAFGSNYSYDKVALKVTDRIRIPPIGYVDYLIQAGKVFGAAPYPLLELHGGNETYVYDPYAFNMMNYYEFVSDQYITFQAQHHFDGFFLNHIPLMRKLKWREVVSGKYLAGSVSDANSRLLNFPSTLSSLNQGPYYEVGAGIENILRLFRIDALWRLSYLNHPNIAKFGLRGTIQFVF